MIKIIKLSVPLVILTSAVLLLFGCGREVAQKAAERRAAQKRLSDAFTPPAVNVTNGQVALLQRGSNYVAIVPTYVRDNEYRYTVFVSSGHFSKDRIPAQEGSFARSKKIEVDGIQVLLDFGGDNATGVALDINDLSTGIAVLQTTNLAMINVEEVKFQRGRDLEAEDLLKATGADRYFKGK